MPSIKHYFPGILGGTVTFDGIAIADVGDVLDANGNEILQFDTVASAVNNLEIKNAATGNNVVIAPVGGDTNIGVEVTPKGTGGVLLGGPTNFKRQVTDTGGAYATPVVLTAAQSGRVIIVDDAAGLDFTLPAIAAGDIGTHFRFCVTVSVTSNAFRVTAATGDIMFGALWLADFDTANTGLYVTADGSNDLIMSMNGTTTGGKMGTWVEFIATSATQWFVHGVAFGDGTLATPFS